MFAYIMSISVNIIGGNGRKFNQTININYEFKFADIVKTLESDLGLNNVQTIGSEDGAVIDKLSTTTAKQTWPTLSNNDTLIIIAPGQDGIKVKVKNADGTQLGEIDIQDFDKFTDIVSKINTLPNGRVNIASISLEGGSIMDNKSTTNVQQTWPTRCNGDVLDIITQGHDG